MSDRADQMLAALPRGNLLDDAAWSRRHRLLLVLLALHLPVLSVLGILTGRPALQLLVELGPVGAALVAGVLTRSRLARSVAVTAGLVVCSSVLVHLSGGLTEAHFHYFVVLGFVGLYQDWRPYLVALAYVVLGHGVMAAVAPGVIYSDPHALARPWLWSLVHAGFVLAACVAQVILWKQTERQQAAAHDYYARLYEGERAVVAQLRQAQDVKDQLIGVVGHEFRTPLTAIQGFARTLDARFDRMHPDAVQTCTQAIERESKRLNRMVTNLLTASEELVPAPDDHCILHHATRAAVSEITQIAPVVGRAIDVRIPADVTVAMSREATTQLLSNLLDNAVKFAAPDTDIQVTSRHDDQMVVLEVANVGPPISEIDRERIFDAFVQADSSDTRRYSGMGLGLHIVAKIVHAYGGRVGVYCEGPLVIFRAWLPPGGSPPPPAPRRVLVRLPIAELSGSSPAGRA